MIDKMEFILERVAPGRLPSCFKMYACRGEGKGCKRNSFRDKKIHCDDCLETNDAQTLGEIQELIKRGDA